MAPGISSSSRHARARQRGRSPAVQPLDLGMLQRGEGRIVGAQGEGSCPWRDDGAGILRSILAQEGGLGRDPSRLPRSKLPPGTMSGATYRPDAGTASCPDAGSRAPRV